MDNEENYIIENETTNTEKKQEYWSTGIGLNKVDNLEPSRYLLDLSQKNINGELKYYEIENLLKTYYETQDAKDIKIQREKECDLVSLRIAMILEDKSFGFSPITLKNIHRHLFKDIYSFAGQYRDFNITKKEPILNGDTVKYVNYQDIESYFETYITTYIERDIRQLINVQDELKFYKFISNIAVRTGQELNMTDICNEIGISNMTGDSWLSILTNTGLVYLLQPYSNNNIARIVKKPKIYFMDTGLACYLAGYLNAVTLEKSAFNGAIFETYVITEIIKSYTNQGMNARKYLYYYRDNNGKEIDLLIIYNNKVYPIEIKKSANPPQEAIKNFKIVDKFGLEVGDGGIICMKENLFPINENNNFIPVELI